MSDPVTVTPPAGRRLRTGVTKDHFLSPHWYQRDLEAVWLPRWHYVTHASELSQPGAFVTYRLGTEEVIICRTKDGPLAAYYNFCPHRGHRLCTQERGIVERNFVCPYHAWAYSKEDGACLSANRMEKDFDRSKYSLSKAWVENFNGLVFVSIADKKPESIADKTKHLTTPGDGIGGYDVSRMKLAATVHLDFHANWKVVRENDDECYHCAYNHPELVQGYDPWHGFTVVEDLDNPQHLWTSDEWALIELGNAYKAHKVCAIPSPRCDGNDGYDQQDIQFFFQPDGHVLIQRDHVWIWTIKPIGPESTLVTQQWLVHESAQEGRDYEIQALVDLFDVTIRQDLSLCENVQRGVRMRHYSPGPLNPQHQAPAGAFYEWYEQCLAEVG